MPRKGFFITPLLLDINIMVFILMLATGVHIIQPDGESLMRWGANYKPVTLDGEWWRLLSCCFIHIGVIHLLMNMYALLYIGLLLEPRIGSARFLFAYIFTGIAASLTSLAWNVPVVSAGASGAVFGMYGVFLALLTTNIIEKNQRKALMTSMLIFVGYNLLNGLKPNGGIDNAAHVGGLLSGILVGYALLPAIKNPARPALRWGAKAALTVALMAAVVVVFKNTPNDFVKYQQKMQQFADNEKIALQVYDSLETSGRAQLMKQISTGVKLWEENTGIIEEVGQYELTAGNLAINTVLKQYCSLRVKSYDLLYKTVADSTEQYIGQIQQYNAQIEELLKGVNGEE